MIAKVSGIIDRLMIRYTPDPFVIALLLTILVAVLGFVLTPCSPLQMIEFWGQGFWDILSFTLQMVMILVGGFVIASSPPIQKLLKLVTSLTKTPTQAVIMTTLVSCVASLINWGLGLVVGAFVAVEMARRVRGTNFRILVASAYSGFLLWHGGLSGSIPLVVNTPGNFSEKWIGGTISVSETLFSSFNIATVIILLVLLPLLNVFMAKENQNLDLHDTPSNTFVKPKNEQIGRDTLVKKIEHSSMLPYLFALLALFYLLYSMNLGTFKLDLNNINFIFLFLGFILHKTPHAFLNSVNQAASKVGPILIQYPFYAGIMGMMKLSGLADLISQGFVSISNATTFPWFTFLSAGVVNFFVPSGGGQWAIQAPIVIQAAQQLNAPMGLSIMAVAWGDAWTNLAQPFWALPLLSIAGLGAKDIMGFCLTNLVVTGLVISSLLLIFTTLAVS